MKRSTGMKQDVMYLHMRLHGGTCRKLELTRMLVAKADVVFLVAIRVRLNGHDPGLGPQIDNISSENCES